MSRGLPLDDASHRPVAAGAARVRSAASYIGTTEDMSLAGLPIAYLGACESESLPDVPIGDAATVRGLTRGTEFCRPFSNATGHLRKRPALSGIYVFTT